MPDTLERAVAALEKAIRDCDLDGPAVIELLASPGSYCARVVAEAVLDVALANYPRYRAAAATLTALGYTYEGGDLWQPPGTGPTNV